MMATEYLEAKMAEEIVWHFDASPCHITVLRGALVVMNESKRNGETLYHWRVTRDGRLAVGSAVGFSLAVSLVEGAVDDMCADIDASGDSDHTSVLRAQLEAAEFQVEVLRQRLHQAAGDLELAKAAAEAMA